VKKRKPRVGETSALDLIEDAIHLARETPWRYWLIYYLGTIPFVVGFLFFWSDMSSGAFAREHLFGSSFLLAIGFVVMKACQASTMSAMRARVSGESPGEWTPSRARRTLVTQAILSPWGLLIRPVALLITVPYAWIAAAYQNMVILGDGTCDVRSVWKESIRLARLWPRQNHEALVVLWLFMLMIWINITSILTLTPALLKLLLGIELLLSPGSWSILNSTFFFVTCAFTYLFTDPLFKAFYVVRAFRGAALSTGADIRADLDRFRKPVSLALLTAACISSANLQAQPEPNPEPSPSPINPSLLDEEIGKTLDSPRFAWRMPRERDEEHGVVGNFFEDAWNAIRSGLDPVGEWVGDFFEWLQTWFDPPQNELPSGLPDLTRWHGALIVTAIVLILAALAIAIWFVWKRKRPQTAQAETGAIPATPDLASDDLLASELPEEEWLRIASEQSEKGEYRFALRALYLAGLAHLGERNLVSPARHKSNLEYERELARRSRNNPELTTTFHRNIYDFERVWYGEHPIDAESLGQYEQTLTRLMTT